MLVTFALILACVLLCLLTFLPFSKHRAWWVRIWDFPRLQIACLLTVLLGAVIWLQPWDSPLTWVLLLAGGGALAVQLWWITPYLPLFRREVKTAAAQSGATLSMLVSNVLAPNRNSSILLKQIREYEPDLVVTLESDLWWQRQLDSLAERYPHSLKCPLDNLYGMHLYSKLPLEAAELAFLVEEDVPSMHTQIALGVGVRVSLHFLHPAPPSPTENPESTERDVELLMLARRLEGNENPVIVAGDLNDVAWSRTTRLFRKLSGLLDPRVGRGLYSSFHADYRLLRWPLDHLFHSDHFGLVRLARLAHMGSDHFPLFVELCYLGANTDQDGLEQDNDDRAEAEETVREGSRSIARGETQ